MSYLDKASLKVVGTRPVRPDGVEKVIGRANFGADMTMPGMIWAKIKRSPHAHARIKAIDTQKALALPGRQGGRHGGGFSGNRVRGSVCRRGADELPRPVAQLHGARQGAL